MASDSSASPDADHVIGMVSRDGLSAVLVATHRAGFGPQTRVFDGARGDVVRQLERAGVRPQGAEALPADAVLIVVTAPGRVAIVADMFGRLGADAVQFASRGSDRPMAEAPPLLAPDIRLPGEAGTPTEA